MNTLDAAVTILKSFDIEPRPMDRIVDDFMSRHHEFGSRNRRTITELVFGVTRWIKRLDCLLTHAGFKRPDHKQRVMLYAKWKAIEEIDFCIDAKLTNIRCDNEYVLADPRLFKKSPATMYSFPNFLWDRIVENYGREMASEVCTILNEASTPTIRINTQKTDVRAIADAIQGEGGRCTATHYSPFGLRLDKRMAIEAMQVYKDGLIELQDESSQLACVLAGPKAGDLILEPCAGFGGKTLVLAMLLKNLGHIISSDIDASKFEELKMRCRKAGITTVETIPKKTLLEREDLKERCNLVFIDAPCTGTGTIRRAPDLKWRLDEATIAKRVETQKKIVEEYRDFVRPGGRLLYATCSILREENEEIVDRILKDGKFEVINALEVFAAKGIDTNGLVTKEGYMRTDPTKADWDGFFAALLRRKK